MKNYKKKLFSVTQKLFNIFICLVLVFSLTACEKEEAPKEYLGYYFFSVDVANTGLVHEEYSPKSKETDALIDEFIEKMSTQPKNSSKKQLLPQGVIIEDYSIDSNGNLTLYFNSAYTNTTGISEILMRAAIVKNLVQIPDIVAVQFYVSGQPLTDSNLNPIGLLTAADFIDNTGGETNYTQQVNLTLYFADSTGDALKSVPVKINYDSTMSVEESIITQLMKGPEEIKGIEEDNLKKTIPDKTKINKITIKDKTCYIDFSDDFLNKRSDISSLVAIYSVVNTLTELPNVDKVQFSIDGQQATLYNDTINFGTVFERNLDIVK